VTSGADLRNAWRNVRLTTEGRAALVAHHGAATIVAGKITNLASCGGLAERLAAAGYYAAAAWLEMWAVANTRLRDVDPDATPAVHPGQSTLL